MIPFKNHSEGKFQHRKKSYTRRAVSKLFALLFIIVALLSGQLYWQEDIDRLYIKFVNHEKIKNLLSLKHVDVVGYTKLSRDLIISQSNLKIGDNILAINLEKVYSDLNKNGWVESVAVLRVYPNTIRIQITEEQPHAIWWNNDKFFLISSNGKIIQELKDPSAAPNYLLIFGEKANFEYTEIYNKLVSHSVYERLVALSSVNGRRWDLHLQDSSLVMLPENDVDEALILLDNLHKNATIEKRAVERLDMRLIPEKIFVKYKQ